MTKRNSTPSTTGGQHDFSTNARAEIQRSQFTRNCGHKTAFDAGKLIPFFVEEVLPGDTMNLRTTTIARFATPLFPIMDNVYVDTQFFFVPNRLVWENWEKFQGAQENPGDSIDFLVPQVETEVGGVPENTIFDYMGLPIGISDHDFCALFPRAYNLIWNEWYRDQNLQDSITVKTNDGPDVLADYEILPRGKRHDYFTSCLPFPQKGPAVSLPLGTAAPIVSVGDGIPQFGNTLDATERGLVMQGAGLDAQWDSQLAGTRDAFWADTKLEVDLSTATAATINQLRLAFQVQRVLERDARGGTRYVESIKSHFGVTSPDFRLQRPEYLGGGSSQVTFNQVESNSQSSIPGVPGVGLLAAYGVSQGHGQGFQKSFTEHGVIIGIISARADLNYQQGENRMWARRTRYDFFIPALAHLGEQAVLNREIYMDGTPADNEVFGYQERWAEYRYKPSITTGLMRSTNSIPTDQWHLAQEFSTRPTLGPDFIEENPPIDRVVSVPAQPDFLLDAYFSYKCARPMPVRSTPGLIDHF